jgi:GMP synthase - Glutamine amidotransferase domain
MKKILIIRNESSEGGGLLYDVLREMNISADEMDLAAGMPFPSPLNYGALIVLGGPDSANDTTEMMTTEIARIQEALKAGIPYLGICLGLQTLVKSVGGKVVKSPVKETGFRGPDGELFRIELTEAGKNDPLFESLGDNFPVFQLHGETVEPTDSMTVLGIGKFCRNQIVKVADKSYGIQCHFELTREMFVHWMDEVEDLKAINQEKCVEDFCSFFEEYMFTGKQLFRNFLKIAGYK